MRKKLNEDTIDKYGELIVKRFEEICAKNDIKQADIYKSDYGLAKGTISGFFNRTYKTQNLSTIIKLCYALGISLADVFDHEYFK